MRHQQWDQMMEFLDSIAGNLGTSIFDTRCNKSWDVGQAVCAEAYGPSWMDSETFHEWNCKDDDEPPEPHYFKCAKKMASGYIPGWVGVEE